MKYLLLICLLVMGCKSAEKLASERAAKEEKARQEEMALLEKMRQKHPCAPGQIIQGKTVFLPGDSIPCPADTGHGDRSKPVYVKCPDQKVRVDTFIKLDLGWLRQYQDSLAAERYAGDLARQDGNEQAKRADKAEAQIGPLKDDRDFWRRSAVATWIAIALAVGGWASLKIFK